ncbi:MAG TPA: hypothetical protein VFR37_19220, partial [Longimicrobium sp.]|nr:hypothetical protein [Longimicrobium sp.]
GSYQRRKDPVVGYEFEDRSLDTGVAAAVGVEWFPVRRVSFTGHTGAELFARRFEQHADGPDDQEFDMEGSSLFLRTFTTALTLQIYF